MLCLLSLAFGGNHTTIATVGNKSKKSNRFAAL